jgi:hypothetical protein
LHFPQFGGNPELIRELSGMAEFDVEYGYFQAGKNLEWSRQINPDMVS